MAAQFLDIGTEDELDLTNLRIYKNGAIATDGAVLLNIVGITGTAAATYKYISTAVDLSEGFNLVEGWADKSGNVVKPGTVVFSSADAFWIQSPSADYSIQWKGKVGVKDVEPNLPNGYSLSGNSFPTTVDLTDIQIFKNGVLSTDGNVLISTINESGTAAATYKYISTAVDLSEGFNLVEGWADKSGNVVKTGSVIFPAGQGFWIQTSSEGYTIRFPAPEGL